MEIRVVFLQSALWGCSEAQMICRHPLSRNSGTEYLWSVCLYTWLFDVWW